MRRILITNQIKAIARGYADNLFSGRQSDFGRPLDNLDSLKNHLNSHGKNDHANYVSNIIVKFYFLLRIEPQYFDRIYLRHFQPLLADNQLIDKFRYKGHNKAFYDHVVDAMRYDAVRSLEFLPCVKQLGIRTCVYCNTQFAITTEVGLNKLSGRYELDHFYPKSIYPFLCISFFNLQPSCSHCNKSKSQNRAKFGLYTTNHADLSPFEFSLDKASLVRYMLSQNSEDLHVIFDGADSALLNDHLKHFHITELYNTQKDIVEEIVWKSKIYNKCYLENLEESFSRLFSNRADFKRFILGNYDNSKDIHKRPMSKLIQDIAKQLGLLK